MPGTLRAFFPLQNIFWATRLKPHPCYNARCSRSLYLPRLPQSSALQLQLRICCHHRRGRRLAARRCWGPCGLFSTCCVLCWLVTVAFCRQHKLLQTFLCSTVSQTLRRRMQPPLPSPRTDVWLLCLEKLMRLCGCFNLNIFVQFWTLELGSSIIHITGSRGTAQNDD